MLYEIMLSVHVFIKAIHAFYRLCVYSFIYTHIYNLKGGGGVMHLFSAVAKLFSISDALT